MDAVVTGRAHEVVGQAVGGRCALRLCVSVVEVWRGPGRSPCPAPAIHLPAHAELFEVCPELFGEFRGSFADVVEPGAELDDHGLSVAF